MLNLQNSPIFFSKTNPINAYVITLENNNISLELSKRCVTSLEKINMPYKVWFAADGTSDEQIILPEHLKQEEPLS